MANPVPLKPSVPMITPGANVAAVIPANVGEMMQLADMLAKSEMVPKNYIGKPQDIVVAMMYGMELGMPPLASLRHVAVINGKPCLYGDGQLGIAMGKGMVEAIRENIEGEGEAMRATCSVKRKGMVDPTIQRFSVADAKRAGLWGKAGPWTLYPKRMMQMRARSFALRDAFPDLLLGMSAEEAADAGIGPDNARDITPQAEAQPRPASKLEAMEAAIAGEAPADPLHAPTFEQDFGMPASDNLGEPSQPELLKQPSEADEAYERAEKAARSYITKILAATDPVAITNSLIKNKATIEAWPLDIKTVVYEQAAARKAALGA